MSVVRFRDTVYVHYKSRWFVWESAWDGYRPVDALRWTGERFEADDRAYTADPTSEEYGYGSDKMREACEALTEQFPRDKAVDVPHLPLGPLEWFRDRMVSLSPCAPRDNVSWKRMAGGRTRTCRAGPRNRFTKRNFIHV
jgi:hypothetical protein